MFSALLRPDATFYTILVLDECSVRDGAEIWNVLKNRSEKCRVVAIDHDPSEGYDAAMREILCPVLDDHEIATILNGYVSNQFELFRWVPECGGSPRMAHLLGENLRANPGDVLRSPGTVPIWERSIAGRCGTESTEVQQRLVVLRHLALFTKFRYEDPVQEEAKHIAGLARKVDSSLSWGRFQEIVQFLRKRRIIQGQRTLFIAPRLLQVWLWRAFWENYGRDVDLAEFLAGLPRSLWWPYTQMLRYAREPRVARRTVEKFLGRGGGYSRSAGQQVDDVLRVPFGVGGGSSGGNA